MIGITGQSGAGKTTLSNMIAEKSGAPIIHMDSLLDDIRNSKVLDGVMQEAEYAGERESKMVNKKLSNVLYSNEIITRTYLKARSVLLNRLLQKQISQYQQEGTPMVIVEGIDLVNSHVIKEVDILAVMHVPYHERIDRIARRDGAIDKHYIVERDKRISKKYTKKIKRPIDFDIENNSLEQLEVEANKIMAKMQDKKKESEAFRDKLRKMVGNVTNAVEKKQVTTVEEPSQKHENEIDK